VESSLDLLPDSTFISGEILGLRKGERRCKRALNEREDRELKKRSFSLFGRLLKEEFDFD